MVQHVGTDERWNVEKRLAEIGVRFDGAEMNEFRRALADLESMRLENGKALSRLESEAVRSGTKDGEHK